MVKIVESPITRRGSKVSGNEPSSSPGAFSNPSRGDRRRDSAEPEPSEPQRRVERHAQEPNEPAPLRHDQEPRERDECDELARGDSVTVQQSMMDFYLSRSLGAAHIKIG